MNTEIADSLAPLFKEADRTGKWFNCDYHDIWFSADELRANHAKGSFVWGAVNWSLKDPLVHIETLQRRIANASSELNAFLKRVDDARSNK